MKKKSQIIIKRTDRAFDVLMGIINGARIGLRVPRIAEIARSIGQERQTLWTAGFAKNGPLTSILTSTKNGFVLTEAGYQLVAAMGIRVPCYMAWTEEQWELLSATVAAYRLSPEDIEKALSAYAREKYGRAPEEVQGDIPEGAASQESDRAGGGVIPELAGRNKSKAKPGDDPSPNLTDAVARAKTIDPVLRQLQENKARIHERHSGEGDPEL